MDTAHLTTPRDRGPVDLRHLDGTLANVRRWSRDVAAMEVALAEARDRLATAPDDVEARHRARMAWLQLKGEAVVLASQFAHLAQEGVL